MADLGERISVVIPTYQRREQCVRAVRSALEQEPPPLEVLVCDNASTDGTEKEFRGWAQEDPRVRYLRLDQNPGTPGPARNLGAHAAGGDWLAFLDDDDKWLRGKLEIQIRQLGEGRYDVVASDAIRSSGGLYFGMAAAMEPTRDDFLAHNPIIVSTAVVRRDSLLAIGGFSTKAAGFDISGVEDYALWLALSEGGARFLISPEPLIEYRDHGARMSDHAFRHEAAVAAVRWRQWLRNPGRAPVLSSALRGTVDAIRWRIGRPARSTAGAARAKRS